MVDALNLDLLTLSLSKINNYIDTQDDSSMNYLEIKQNLSFASDQIVLTDLFDVLVNIGMEYLTAKSQFLGKILRQNIMYVRFQRKLEPFDLYLIKSIMT